MTVVSGRARGGARAQLRALAVGLFAVLGLIAGGCGNNTVNYGTVVTTVSSAPGPFTAYVVDLLSFYLVLDNGNTNFGFTGSRGIGKTIDFTQLGDTTELMGALAVAEGTYTSATLSFNYGNGSSNVVAAQLYVDINGQSVLATLIDPASTASPPAAPGTVSYTIKFDPAHKLVVKRGTPVQLDFHFDMSASSIIDTSVSPPKVTVRPFLTASTVPNNSQKPMRARGEFVIADKGNNNFTVNMRSFFDVPDYTGSAQGALQVQVTDQTTYNVNGSVYRGSDGLAALAALPQNTAIASYGSLGDITPQKPIFNATEVYAGIAIEDALVTRAIGTVVSRSGNTIHLHNARLVLPPGGSLPGSISSQSNVVDFANDITLKFDDKTIVNVDGQPTVASNNQLISIGQQIDAEGIFSSDSSNNVTIDSSGGLIRLTRTPAWGTLSSATPGTATVNLLSLGGTIPGVTTFTGTGAAGGADADPTAYVINTGSVDLSAAAAGSPLLRFDGIVAPFGSAAPAAGTADFTASTVRAGTPAVQGLTPTEQVLAIEWTSTGTTAPFANVSAAGLVVNLSNSALGKTHSVQTGPAGLQTAPALLDLTTDGVNPTIVPDPNLTGQFSIGAPTSTNGIDVFHSFSDYIGRVNSGLNGTNTILKLVAVGRYDQPSHTFTAYRIDMVQLP
jgi:hypothetical protein